MTVEVPASDGSDVANVGGSACTGCAVVGLISLAPAVPEVTRIRELDEGSGFEILPTAPVLSATCVLVKLRSKTAFVAGRLCVVVSSREGGEVHCSCGKARSVVPSAVSVRVLSVFSSVLELEVLNELSDPVAVVMPALVSASVVVDSCWTGNCVVSCLGSCSSVYVVVEESSGPTTVVIVNVSVALRDTIKVKAAGVFGTPDDVETSDIKLLIDGTDVSGVAFVEFVVVA